MSWVSLVGGRKPGRARPQAAGGKPELPKSQGLLGRLCTSWALKMTALIPVGPDTLVPGIPFERRELLPPLLIYFWNSDYIIYSSSSALYS